MGNEPLSSAEEQMARVLDERAADMARRVAGPDLEDGIAQDGQVVCCWLGGELYGIAAEAVREALPLHQLAPLPGTPAHVLGLLNVRGQIVSVHDLRGFLSLAGSGLADLHRVLLLQHGAMEFGVAVDAIVGMRTLRVEELGPSPPGLGALGASWVRGVTSDGLIVLDAERLLADPALLVDERGRGRAKVMD